MQQMQYGCFVRPIFPNSYTNNLIFSQSFLAFFDVFCQNTGAPDSKVGRLLIEFSSVCGRKYYRMIRDDLKIILGEEFRFLAIKTRERLHLTQREMSDKLQMSESSYSDIERGVYKCSALSVILLLNLQDDPICILNTVNEKFRKWYEREMMPV